MAGNFKRNFSTLAQYIRDFIQEVLACQIHPIRSRVKIDFFRLQQPVDLADTQGSRQQIRLCFGGRLIGNLQIGANSFWQDLAHA